MNNSSIKVIASKKAAQEKGIKSDSLINESRRKKEFARVQEKIANAQIKRGTGNNVKLLDLKGTTTPTASKRLDIAKKIRQSAEKDSLNYVKKK